MAGSVTKLGRQRAIRVLVGQRAHVRQQHSKQQEGDKDWTRRGAAVGVELSLARSNVSSQRVKTIWCTERTVAA
jgi:hypothetical protein